LIMNTPTPPEERPHHPFSPSWLQSGEVCPDFKSRSTEHARTIAGTIGHKIAETGEDDMRLSDDDALAVAECLDFYESRRKIMQAGADEINKIRADARDSGSGVMVPPDAVITEGSESYLPIDDCKFDNAEATTAGYVDRWILSWDKTYAEVMDWKFGMWQVEEAANNLQGMAYTLGLFRRFPTLEKVRFYFKQPLIDYLTFSDFTRADVARIYLRIQTIVARARLAREKGDFSMANPAVPVCNFCARIGECPKVLALACKVGHKYHPVGIPESVTPSVAQDPKNTMLGLELASVLKVWAEAFRKQVTERVIRGDAPMPEGYQSQTIRKRELVDMAKYRELALEFLSSQEWEACLDTTFSAVEKQISAKAARGVKEATVKEFQAKAAAAGATKLGDPISFLKVSGEKSTSTST
jgi:hypothetical protein